MFYQVISHNINPCLIDASELENTKKSHTPWLDSTQNEIDSVCVSIFFCFWRKGKWCFELQSCRE